MSADLISIKAELLWNSSKILIRKPISEELCSHLFLQVARVDTKSDDSGNLMKFLTDIDQNTGGKFWRKIYQMTSQVFKNFDQNFGLEMQLFILIRIPVRRFVISMSADSMYF